MRYLIGAAFVLTGILGGCAGKPSAVKTGNASSASMAVAALMNKMGHADFGRCFKVHSRNERFVNYLVVDDKPRKRQCGIMVAATPGSAPSNWSPAVIVENMEIEECDLRALSCLNPAAAREISERYGLKLPSSGAAR